MIIFYSLGAISICLVILLSIILKQVLSVDKQSDQIASFLLLLGQSIQVINRRMVWILIQFMVISNIILLVINGLLGVDYKWKAMITFDFALLFFIVTIKVMLMVIPQSLARILSKKENGINAIINQIILVGSFQSISFLAVFVAAIYGTIIFFGIDAMIYVTCAILVVAFYYRLSGGVYKAASDKGKILCNESSSISLLHPAQILSVTGNVVASITGYLLDVFSSWAIAIAGYIAFILINVGSIELNEVINLPEIQWVFGVIVVTVIGVICSIPFGLIRKNTDNIYLEMGYFIISLSFIGTLLLTNQLLINQFPLISLTLGISLITMLGVAFFTNYITSAQHQPIRFICSQAQHGVDQLLIASFFNGLVGNAIFILILLIAIISMLNAVGIIGLLMMIVYMLSIAVAACIVKMFSVVSTIIINVFESENKPVLQNHVSRLKSLSSTLVPIGNSFSTAAGVLSSISIFIPVISIIVDEKIWIDLKFGYGIGLGIVVVSMFYALFIGGTQKTLVQSMEEVFRQFNDIPLLGEKGKAHPNIKGFSDMHSVNVLKTLTLPGIWIVISLIGIFMLISTSSIFGALVGIFMTVFIQSFCGPSLGIQLILYSDICPMAFLGKRSAPFKDAMNAHWYSQYFQWVLSPAGVIIMKFVGIIIFLIFII